MAATPRGQPPLQPVTLFSHRPWGSQEDDYLRYTLPRRTGNIRAGAYFSLVSWVEFLVAVWFTWPGQFLFVLAASAPTFGTLIVTTIALSHRPGREKTLQVLAAGANLLSGAAAVVVTGVHFRDPTLLSLSVIVIVFFAFFVFHLTFFLALLTTLPYLLGGSFFLLLGSFAQPINGPAVLVLMAAGWVSAVIGGHYWEVQERNGYLLREELSRINRKLSVQARTDPLTGLLNRAAFFEVLGQRSLKVNREQDRFVLAMVDLDHFKGINDRYGHQRGDAILAEFARIMEQSFRGDDVPARYGGEEFVLLIHLPDLETAGEALERFREKVAVHGFAGVEEPVTCSIGAALQTSGTGREELILRADRNLYRAKTEGRNCLRL